MQKNREMMAVQTLAAAANLYLNTLDDFARPLVSSHLQSCIEILMMALHKRTEEDGSND